MTVTVIQPAKASMQAEAYDIDKGIAIINAGEAIQTHVYVSKQQSAKHDYYVFEVTQIQLASGKESIIQVKKTTHYHKAIGIAVNMNA